MTESPVHGRRSPAMAECLSALGVRDDLLSDEQRAHLDDQGYLVLRDVLTADEAAAMVCRLQQLVQEEGERAGKEMTHTEDNVDLLGDLVNKDELFTRCFTEPRVLAAIADVVRGDFRLYSVNARNPRCGEGLQSLHADWAEAVEPGDYQICNSIWLLDDFTAENGATRIVPGTHRSGTRPGDVLADPSATHEDEIRVVAPRGAVVVFNSHVWHGGTRNTTDGSRYAITAAFARRDQPQQLDQRAYIRRETYARLTAAERFLMDV